jgi:hypothetical protein
MDKEEFHWLFGVVRGWFSAKLGSKISDGSKLSAQLTISLATNSHRDITNRNQPLLFFHMDPTNSIVWTRKSFIGSLVLCSVGFQFSAKLGSKINDGSQLSALSPWPPTATGTYSHRDTTNRNQPLLFFHMDPTNSIVWTKKSFIGSLVLCGVGFQQNLGQKSVMGPSCQHNFLGHQQPQGHNKQESTTFILPHGSNKQHCMDKEEFHWTFDVVRCWFSAKLGSKISDGSQLSALSPWPPTTTGT